MDKITLSSYYKSFADKKLKALEGSGNYFWIQHEVFATIRFPENNLEVPTYAELTKIFKRQHNLVINYTVLPMNKDLANAYLYNCGNTNYNIDSISSTSVRRNIRLAKRNLQCRFASKYEILNYGMKAFKDTRTRVGLSDGTRKNFINRFTFFFKNPAHNAVAAWFNDELIAFMSLIVVDDLVIIQGTFSTNEHKNLKPNNVLVDFVLSHYLTKEKFRLVCYGLSSIQEDSFKDGLHNFKIQVGFDAIPVQRVVVFNPIIKKLQIPLKYIFHILLKFFPQNRILKKASGLLNTRTLDSWEFN